MDEKTYAEIEKLSQEGDLFAENSDYKKALKKYWKAYDLIPNPKSEWDATLWLLAAIGDANFLSKDFEAGLKYFTSAMNLPDAVGNPFLHLRLGQCHYELGNLKKAADELTRAYGVEGKDIFEGEDPKYFEFLKTIITID